ncbi:MAG TPA: cytochrome c oxidase assembly protein [Chloroflexota bacterium]|nr:cytochrome c oxidase assembly protein [Chloroflexota bacterium]
MTDFHIHWEIAAQLALIEAAYLLAIGPLRHHFVYRDVVRPSRGRAWLFSLGIFIIFLAEATPIHELSEEYLFSVHMTQHLMLVLGAVPLMLLGTPAWMVRPLYHHPLAGPVLRWCTRPLIALVLFNVTLAAWHLPQLYDWTLWNHNAHILEHITFMVTAVFMWWPILSPLPELPRLTYPLQMLYLFVQSLVPGVLAALLTFSDRVIYPTYGAAPRISSLDALADQQLGGLIMKLVGTLMLWVLATVIFFIWANRDERDPGAEERALHPPPRRQKI